MLARTGLLALRLDRLARRDRVDRLDRLARLTRLDRLARRLFRTDLSLLECLLREASFFFLIDLLLWALWDFDTELLFFVPLVGTDWAMPGEKIKAKVNTAAMTNLFAIQHLLG